MVVLIKSKLQLIVKFVYILTLIVVLFLNLVLYLEADSSSGLLQLVLLSLFVVDLLFSFEEVQGVFFADVAVLGKELDVLQLKVQVEIFELI